MISFLLFNAGFLNLMFYVFAIGFVISLLLEQIIKAKPLSPFDEVNDRNTYIVQTNRKYCWRQAWITNACWFLYLRNRIRDCIDIGANCKTIR